uniref:Uncharacterized protein n=1 Tax=Oryza nivara TaxID=4536 RepID=A0A0E0IKM0_ORYNI
MPLQETTKHRFPAVGGEVGRSVSHPLREHDLAGEPAARIGAAKLGSGLGDGGLMIALAVALHCCVGSGRGRGQKGVGEAAGARLGLHAVEPPMRLSSSLEVMPRPMTRWAETELVAMLGAWTKGIRWLAEKPTVETSAGPDASRRPPELTVEAPASPDASTC